MPRLLVIGAHPDDAELHAGGLMALYRRAGHPVRVVSASNGEKGHQTDFGPGLARRRRSELAAALGVIGGESEVWPDADGTLQPTFELRDRVIREIRTYQPDLVLAHRTCDYHPDHRAIAQAVQDASYLVTVPAIVPDVPHLRRDPVVAFMADPFTRPVPLWPDVFIRTDEVMDDIVAMMHEHTSQVYEWLPYNWGLEAPPAAGQEGERKAWLRRLIVEPLWRETVERFRPAGDDAVFGEAYEISEYAFQPGREELAALFPPFTRP